MLPKQAIITDIMKAWKKVTYKKPQDKREILDQQLWYNTEIRKGKKPYMVEKMFKSGIMTIRDIYDEHQQKFFEYAEIAHSYGNIGNYLDYFSLINNVPERWKIKLREIEYSEAENGTNWLNILESQTKISQKIYRELTQKGEYNYDHGKITWQVELKSKFEVNE